MDDCSQLKIERSWLDTIMYLMN